MANQRKVAVLVGSLRRESFTRKVAVALIRLAPPELEMEIVEIERIEEVEIEIGHIMDRLEPGRRIGFAHSRVIGDKHSELLSKATCQRARSLSAVEAMQVEDPRPCAEVPHHQFDAANLD